MSDYFWGTGRRKTSVARVRIKQGKGEFLVNGKPIADHFHNRQAYLHRITLPLQVTENLGKYDIYVNVKGGGLTGQAGAVTQGLARALVRADETNRPSLKKNGLLTRDSRMVERKKYGFRKARRAKQFSKR